MERRFEVRKQQMLAECEVRPALCRDQVPRLNEFLTPFAVKLVAMEQRQHAIEFCQGLLSNLVRKNVESIAYEHDHDRRNLQHFIGTSKWDHCPLVDELCGQVGAALGEPDGVIVIDPSAFPKQGKKSVGVARQWCGRLGKVDNCQVGIYLGYVSRRGQTLCDFRLFLPKEWSSNPRRCRAAGVPGRVRHRTRHELALEMIAARRESLPHGWITGDDEFGKVAHYRRDLQALGERYLLAAPGNLTVRILHGDELPRRGRGAPPAPPFQSISNVCEQLSTADWCQVDVRDGEKGPLVVEVAVVPRVQAKINRRNMPYAETLVIVRYNDDQGTRHVDYYFSNAAPDTAPAEYARVALAEHRVEECIKRSKSEVGLAHYEVRTWQGWHHHQTLSLIATWFLVQETRRGKKMGTGVDHATAPGHPGTQPPTALGPCTSEPHGETSQATIAA